MIERSFSLIPFPAATLPDISISGKVSLQENIATLHYSLTGKIEDILLPSSANPSRKNDLWKSTCFEFFLAIRDQPQYWEFNLSPSGDWNVYHMDKYRRVGFREETLIQQLAFEVQKETAGIFLNVRADLTPLFQPGLVLEFGVTAIVQTPDGKETYWALRHPAPVADFHLRESFTLVLAEQTLLSRQSAPDD
jgi:hypothetical protein